MWILFVSAVLIAVALWIKRINKDYFILSLCKRIKSVDNVKLEDKVVTIPGITIFGNNFDVLNKSPAQVFDFCRNNAQFAQGKSYIWHFLFCSVYNITNAEDAEEVFQSQALISKGYVYDLLHPFLGTGLLTSSDQKWQFRRKTLTPAFHFNILQTFIEVFKEESYKVVNVLNKRVNQTFALLDVIPEFTLNNLCETALGVKLDNIEGGKEYRESIHHLELTIVKRFCNPLMFYKIIYYLFGDYNEQQKYLKIAHGFSSKVISKKREEFQRQAHKGIEEKTDEYGKKKRYAMLDTLLDAEAMGLIDHQGICDEVNTFMFEGYDTTSTCLIFTLLNLATYDDIQQKCYQELQSLDDIANLTVFDFNRLEYLERVIKETLRLYPSVPFMARKVVNEMKINGLLLPAETQINLHVYDIMRDPKHFPNPLVFDPDRFLPENTINRQPFAFVPFSAGPRNCIGQKFAILEMKVLLVAILKNFVVLPVTRAEDLIHENGLVLRTQQQVMIRLDKRN